MGLAVQVLPLANPLRVAEETAIVDHISEGRLVVGVGRSSFLESYQGYNIDYGESRGRFAESLEVLLKAWFFMGVFAKSFIVVNLNSSWFLKDIFFKILVRN